MSAEYNITFDWNRISTLGKVKVLVEQVISSGGGGGGGGADSRVNLIVGSNIYPLISVATATVSGVSGVIWKYDDGSQDGLNVFVADGTGLNAVKTAIEAELSDVVSAAVTGETGSNIEDYTRLTITNRDSTTSVLNVAPVNTSTGKLSVANLPMKSTITAGNTDPVNSVAVIAYINSLDATNTQY